MSSQVEPTVSAQLDRVLAEHRAGHFGAARELLRVIPASGKESDLSDEDSQRLRELRARFRPDWFAWLMLVGGLLLFVLIVASSWR